MKFPRVWIFFLFIMVSTSAGAEVKSAWPTHGLEICDVLGNTTQINVGTISTSDNGFVAVWEDARDGITNLYAQKFDENGNLLWNRGGIPVCRAAGNQTMAKAISDGGGGAIFVWQDYRSGNSDLYMQRLDSSGAALWEEEGVLLCDSPVNQLAPELVSDGAGGAIVVWHDYRSAAGEDIYAQRIDGSGNPLWQAGGVIVCDAAGTQWFPKMISDRSGGAVIVWTDGRAGSSDNNIYGQRIDAAGASLWGKNGLPLCSSPQNQERPALVAADNGAIVVWNDYRAGNADLFAQKVDLKGKMMWSKEGIAVANAPFAQENPRLARDGAGGALILWEDSRSEETFICAQKILPSGKLGWDENGLVVARSPAKQENPEITELKDGSWAVFWEDYRKGAPLVYAQKLDSYGSLLWSEGGIVLSYGFGSQEKPSAAVTAGGSLVAVWQDRRRGNYDLFSQRISSDGSLLWGQNGMVVCDAPGKVAHQNLAMTDAGQGKIIMAFEDARSGFLNIFLQKLDLSGNLLWGREGLPLARVKANQVDPQVISDGAGGAIIAWEDGRNQNFTGVFTQRISALGQKLWQRGGLSPGKGQARQSRPLLTSDGAGGAIVVWQDERNPLGLKDLYAQRISRDGSLLWGKDGLPFCTENGDQVEAAITSDGAGGAMVVWTDYRQGERNPNIYAQRISADGELLWDKAGLLICGAPDVQRTPQIMKDKEGGAIMVWTDKGGGSYDIYTQRVNKAGQTLWLADGIPINQLSRTQQNPSIGGRQIVVWEDYRFGNWDIYANSISPQGRLLWGEEGVAVANLMQTQYAPKIIGWKDGGVIIAWEDYREGKQYEIFFQKINTEGEPAWAENGIKIKSNNGARAPKLLAQHKEKSLIIAWEDYTGGGKALYAQRFFISK